MTQKPSSEFANLDQHVISTNTVENLAEVQSTHLATVQTQNDHHIQYRGDRNATAG